jgi:flavodoxin
VKALVVYDSVFGNTEKVAQAIGAALEAQAEVSVLKVGDVPPEFWTGLDALIVGSPTRAFSPTPAIKSWLQSLPANSLQGTRVAAFDTRVDVREVGSAILTFMVGIFGYAAKPIGKRLVHKGGELAVPPEGFIVGGREGPLKEGELDRAADWAQRILPEI